MISIKNQRRLLELGIRGSWYNLAKVLTLPELLEEVEKHGYPLMKLYSRTIDNVVNSWVFEASDSWSLRCVQRFATSDTPEDAVALVLIEILERKIPGTPLVEHDWMVEQPIDRDIYVFKCKRCGATFGVDGACMARIK